MSLENESKPDSGPYTEVEEVPVKPEPPKTPFEQFSYETVLHAAEKGVNSDTDLSPGHLEELWDHLGPEGQQTWEARYGRETIEYQKAKEAWERAHPQLRLTFDPELGHNVDYESLNFDSGAISHAWRDFVDTCLTSIFGTSGKQKETQGQSQSPRGGRSQSPGRDHVPRIVFRAELYRLRVRWITGRVNRRKLRANYVKTFEHDAQMEVKTSTSHEEAKAAIFEVTTFLAAPNSNKGRGIRRLFNPASSEASSDELRPESRKYQPEQPIEARAEAGMVLTINSEVIIEAIHSVAPGYPDLAFDGDALVIAEPFCVLLQFRKEMLDYRDALVHNQRSLSWKATDKAAESETTDAKSVDLEVDPALKRQRSWQADHITELYNFMDQKYLEAMDAEKECWKQSEPVCTYEWAWLLFTPGTLVYELVTNEGSLPRAFLVESFQLRGLFHYDRNSKRPTVKPSRLDTSRKLKLRHRLRKITINLTYLRHDGKKWIPARKTVTILPFNGERLITNLPVFPSEYFDDPSGTIRDRLMARGRRYHSLSSRGQFEYHGVTLSGTRRWLNSRIIVDSETLNYDPRLASRMNETFVVRSRSPVRRYRTYSDESDESYVYARRRPGSPPNARAYSGRGPRSVVQDGYDSASDSSLDWDTKVANILGRKNTRKFIQNAPLRKQPLSQLLQDPDSENAEITDEIYIICDRELEAYVLEERDWLLLDVEKITDCTFDENMINDLQINEETKRLIQALSQTYTLRTIGPRSNGDKEKAPDPAPWSSDFVPGKGRGQLILLHGKPGVGKTTAAECVAELTKRPLLSITCGDLGTSTSTVESELTRWLRLGALWNAVLLFDEADIFLESRERGDIERNSLVSVFLRALEYYQGLMFLTTNRVGTFDEAVISRVHVILHFPDLTDDDRARIWDTSFRKLSNERPDVKIDFSIYDYAYRDESIRELSWNGREIRNAFNTMIALAEWDARDKNRYTKDGKIEIRREHLQQVAKMSNGFKAYMRSLRGLDEADHAKLHGLRDDSFTPGSQT